MMMKFLLFIVFLIYLWNITSSLPSIATAEDNNDELRSLLEQVKGIVPSGYSSSIRTKLSNAVFIIMVNHGYVDQARNLDCYMKRLNFKYLAIALDKSAYDEMKSGTDIPVYLSRIHSSFASVSSIYGTPEYASIVKYKTKMVQIILHMGYDVIFSDTDIAIVRDPFPYMVWNDVDYVHTQNAFCDGKPYDHKENFKFQGKIKFEGNTGFYYIRSNQHTLNFYHKITTHSFWKSNKTEQLAFWYSTLRMWPNLAHYERCEQVKTPSIGWNRTQSPIVACMLDRCLFNQGGMQSQQAYDNYTAVLKQMHETPVIMHANWMKGGNAKVEALKHYGIWLVQMNRDNLTHTCIKPRVLHFEDI